ncbi:MAG: carboxypeptidase-like regulatory domain-containing protein [Bacteroidetes bacterium]|jgi:hypothetical protein|nr:carboxypeptidase-like regulatory domain-containing protein [Bacteroidota bacterium]MBT4340264.1 carboxypeptidase-like regulatory domain-containing protein [Bacteroidota bacterium]MBT4728870.1 carboxypeptidase-like regulatory domain-containing protein [Bacteroidota bacterium]MBT7994006.1 carboxypeptidase-like regulatory domain-containing protein [Bacteroidota bacterium]
MKQYLNIIIILITIFLSFNVNGQVSSPTIVKGFVIDSHSEEPLPYATIVFENTNTGTTSNEEGFFILTGIQKSSKIHISSMGYEDTTINIIVGERQTINIKLMPKTILLEEANLSFKRSRYKNKDNPAVELIKKVIENKDNNRKENMDFLSYEKYDKTQFALSNLSERFMNRKSLKKFAFIFENIDTTKLEGALILPIYIKETLSDFYSQKSPEKTKEIIKADKMVSFDGYLNNQGMSQYLNYMYQDIDIYDNTVTFVTNIFLSPIANTATTFYKYFILDTISIAEASYIKVFFSPRNKTDMLFNGYLYITADSNYAIKKLEMSVNENINLNWVKDVSIIQEFEKAQNNSWFLKFDEISIDFGLSENSMGIFGQRSVYYNKFKINEVISDTLLNGAKVIQLEDADNRNSDFWEVNRPVVLSKSEKGIYAITDSIQEIPAFKRTMDVFMLLFAGYKDFGKFEIGPINTFYSYNSIEGPRLRFGGRTTPQFSEKINFETYLAYGLFDNKFKNYLSTTYSFTGNNIYHFPVKSIKLSYQNETQIPGQELQFIQEDNILLSIKRGVNDKLLYNKTIKLESLNEFENHFSYTLGYNYTKQTPAGSLYFNTDSNPPVNNDEQLLIISELYMNLRFAPHEKFYQGKQYRTPMPNRFPIISLNYTVGSTSLGNNYNYQNLKLNIYKRFYPGILGYTDVVWEGGVIFGKVSYPLLYMHRANQTYAYQLASYNLMNFLEFVSDNYTSLNIDHHFYGFIFNKIPVLKKLKLREVASVKILYGTLSKDNNPEYSPDLFKFPVDYLGNKTTFFLEKDPYIEGSVGVENIFKFFRVDLVKRFTYLDNPNVSDIGIRVRFRFDF